MEMRVEEATRLKDIILHEIRNPLFVIGGAEFFMQKLNEALYESSSEQEKKWWESVKMLHQGIEALNSVLKTSEYLGSQVVKSKNPEPVSTLFDDAIAQCSH